MSASGRFTKSLAATSLIILGLTISCRSQAAQVDIVLGGGEGGVWVVVSNNGSVGVGAINFLVQGVTSMQLNLAVPGISQFDSSMTIETIPGWNFVIISNPANGISIVEPGAQYVRLATLCCQGAAAFRVQGSELLLGSDTVFDVNLNPIYSYSIGTLVPEPVTMTLVALGAALIGFLRTRTLVTHWSRPTGRP